MKPDKKSLTRLTKAIVPVITVSPCPILKRAEKVITECILENEDDPKQHWDDELRDDLLLEIDEKWDEYEWYICIISTSAMENLIDICLEYPEPLTVLEMFKSKDAKK